VIRSFASAEAELALLFGKAFGQSPQYWLNLQAQFDLMKAERSIGARLGTVKKIASPSSAINPTMTECRWVKRSLLRVSSPRDRCSSGFGQS